MSCFKILAVGSVLLTACPALASGTVEAAGRIDFIETGGSCSGVLVAPGLVATAAHCTPIIDDKSELPDILFVPGSGQDGIRVVGAARHPLYDPDSSRVEWKLRFDIGILRLADDTVPPGIKPFPIGEDAREGETLFIVSWRRGEGTKPRQRACPVLSVGIPGLVTLGCAVAGGESGAPVLRKTDTNLELVAIISSRSQLLDQPVAQASNVRLRLPPLLDEIAR
jgi:hypothetical protein